MRLTASLISFGIPLLLLASGSERAAAQPSPDAIKFEVAAISVNNSGEERVSGGFQPGGRYRVNNYSLRSLIAAAYLRPQVNPDFLISGGPDWMDKLRFNIEAKASEDFPPGPDGPNAPRRIMLQNLLAERFGLKVHHENRQGRIFALVLAKNGQSLGPQLRPSSVDCGNRAAAPAQSCYIRIAPGSLDLGGVPLSALTNLLPRFVDHVVVDSTGLSGRYDIELTWTPGPTEWVAPPTVANPTPPTGDSSLVTALREQLGLRLQSQTGPVDVLVIDAAHRPTEN